MSVVGISNEAIEAGAQVLLRRLLLPYFRIGQCCEHAGAVLAAAVPYIEAEIRQRVAAEITELPDPTIAQEHWHHTDYVEGFVAASDALRAVAARVARGTTGEDTE